MFTSCTHTLESGKTCKSPAVRGTSLCFNHTPHEQIKSQQPQQYEPFELPNIHSKSGILVAISSVLDQLSMRRIKRSEADTFLRGFNLAARIMTEIDQAPAAGLAPTQCQNAAPERPSAPPQPHHKPARVTPKSNAVWPGSKEPQLVPLPSISFKPWLKSAGINDEPSFVSLLCSKANEVAMSQSRQRVHR